MSDIVYPFKNYRFKVEINGIQTGAFSEVSGIDATYDVVEYREGDAAENTVRKMPGLVKYGNVTLKRGVIDKIEFFTWIDDVKTGFYGDKTRKDITISILKDAASGNGEVAASWTIVRAWPCKYTGPELKGSASEVAIESIEFAHEGLTRTI